MPIRQIWIADDDTTFETFAEAKLYELRREYAVKIFTACGDYFTTDQVIECADAVRDLLDAYLIKRAELQK